MKQGKFYKFPNRYKYSLAFESQIKPVISEDKDKYLSLASLENVKKFIPNIDTERNIDLVPFACDAFVANRLNKNDDAVTAREAVLIADLFKFKPVDIEHDRKKIVGVILTASFTEFGSSNPINLSPEEMSNITRPFNVTLGGVLWRVANDDLIDYIEESNDPNSADYMKISASWEIAFSDYQLIIIDANKKNIEDGKIISDPNDIEKLEKQLKAYGGSGKIDGKRIGRIAINDVVPIGIGLTETPAADVKGIAVNTSMEDLKINEENMKESKENKKEDESQETSCAATCPECGAEIEMEDDMDEESEVSCSKCGGKTTVKKVKSKAKASNNNENIKNIEKHQENCVKKDSENMNIASLKDINDENLKTATAVQITSLLDMEIQRISNEFVAKEKELENASKAAQEKVAVIEKEKTDLVTEVASLKEQLNKINEANALREREELFTARMEQFDAEYDLTDEDRTVIGNQIKDINEENFKAFANNMSILLKDKKKGAKKPVVASASTDTTTTTTTDTTPVTTNAVSDAIKNGEPDKDTVAATTSVTPDIKAKYAEHFGVKNWKVNTRALKR